MARESDFFQKIFQAIQSEDFKTATASITGITNEEDERNDAVFGCVASLFSRGNISEEQTLDMVKQIIAIYNQSKDSPKQLKEALSNLESKFGIAQEKVTAYQELGDLSSWTEKQLEDRLSKLKKEQQTLLSSGKTLDPKAGQQLNKLLEEQSKRLGYEGKKISEEELKEVPNQEGRPEGADAWFVTPTPEELASNIKTLVICGSPIIQVFRERYKREYKIKKILDANLSKLGTLSGDEEYEIKRESNRQRDFVSNYMDPTLVLDQDMCAYSIASEFLTDKYIKPELVRIDDNLAYYVFETGALKDLLDSNKVQHSFSTEGTVVGRFAICLNRKEPQSGRFISDAYDIIEFQDGQPFLYFCSAKGVSSLSSSMLKEIKQTMKNTGCDLSLAAPAVAKKMASEIELDKFIQEHKASDSPIYNDKPNEDQPVAAAPQEAGSTEHAKPEITNPIPTETMPNLNETPDSNPDKKTPQPEESPNPAEPTPIVEEYEPLILDEAPAPVENEAKDTAVEPDSKQEAAADEVKVEEYEPLALDETPESNESVVSAPVENETKDEVVEPNNPEEAAVDEVKVEEYEPLVLEPDQGEPEATETTIESNPEPEAPQPEDLPNPVVEEPLPTVDAYEPLDLDEAPEPVEAEGVKPEANEAEKITEENQDEKELNDRMARLEKIVITSAEALDKMEKELSKVSDFVSAVQQDKATTDESSILKRRAEAIKEAIKKKKDSQEEES